MTTRQGSLALLDDEVAQRLLRSPLPARLAYSWTDGSPRVVPIGFHWNGKELVFGTPPDAPKMRALRDGDRAAVSIDTDEMPYKVLQIRGRVRTDTVEGIAPEYEAMTVRMLGEEQGRAWLTTLRAITTQMSRVFVTPEWVAVLDFESRFPSALERAMEHAASA
ncbi:pyridoxamine 5'-phosphate oxidase family protein [Terracoccus sp. 273MFTsu3.1]|uniref:pyridoxamine 5'-phosphate oxidase family protein n=1 Tax=Terracoccus sp. 273MFTsu3.1 TaxID=1172188 RepID=UPI000365DD67|nr:pyridoxamine 5'-phosphate oxidase family protein [Terracoccus sp. 273MFTsu3.1]